MRYLRADTAVVVPVGPLVAIVDGFTTVDAATVTDIDCGIKKAGTAGASISLTASGGANDMTPTANNPGHYDMEIPAADVDIEGPLRYTFNDVDVCYPFYEDFVVVNANVYDSLFAVATTDYLQVDALQIAGSAALAAIEGEVTDSLVAHNLDHLALTATAAADMTAEVADDTILSRMLANGDTSVFDPSTDGLEPMRGVLDEVHAHTEAIAVTGSALNQIAESDTLAVGTETSGTYVSTQIADGIEHVLTVAANEIDIYYQFDIGATGVPVSVRGEGWLQEGPPAGGDTIDLYAYNWDGPAWELIHSAVFTGITSAGPVEAFNHNLLARHVGTGGNDGIGRIRFQAGSLEAGTTLNMDHLFVSFAEVLSAELAKVPKSDSNVSWNAAALAAIEGEVDDGIANSADIAALPTAAEVNAEVLDVMNVDTFAEPAQGAPGATISLVAKIGYLMKNWRNKKLTTATQESLLNDDAVTVDHKSVLSDNGVTFSKGEVETGP